MTQKDDLSDEEYVKNAARILGMFGGLKGGPARAKKLSSQERISIAKKAANIRWARKKSKIV